MQELFVTYEQAMALKELGFDEPCLGGWDKPGDWWWHPDSDITIDGPLKSQVFRWFREKYNLFHCIEPHFSSGFNIYIKGIKNEEPYHIVYKTYDFAESECIDNLIKIIKEKK